jgi:hypothetical protein
VEWEEWTIIKTRSRWLVGIGLLLCVTCTLEAIRSGRVTHEVGAPVDAPGILTAKYTGQKWYDKPVYALKNSTGHNLDRLTLYSWSEEELPILHLGQMPPPDLPHIHVTGDPPYTVRKNETVWFVGPSTPPSRFTVMWIWAGKQYYATINGAR